LQPKGYFPSYPVYVSRQIIISQSLVYNSGFQTSIFPAEPRPFRRSIHGNGGACSSTAAAQLLKTVLKVEKTSIVSSREMALAYPSTLRDVLVTQPSRFGVPSLMPVEISIDCIQNALCFLKPGHTMFTSPLRGEWRLGQYGA
jgi:hypothetical protein